MVTIENYILERKKKDKLDEFNFKNHTENMTKVISYVMDYFNDYLNPEAYDYENIKTEQAIQKIRQELETEYPESIDFIVQYYTRTKSRIDKIFRKWFETLEYKEFIYSSKDFEEVVNKFCKSSKVRNTGIDQYINELILLSVEVKKNQTEKPSPVDFKFLDSKLVTWIQNTYREYGVNLYAFAQELTLEYYEKYVEHIFNSLTSEHYRINHYNHRYNDNPFEIDSIYNDNKHRSFIEGRKYELEMLIMYDWIFYTIDDSEYWPEYVNLCISTNRVNLVKNINKLLPVELKGMKYPSDIESDLQFEETTNGLLNSMPDKHYILRLSYLESNDMLWKDKSILENVINNLNYTFKTYGEPYVLELMSPIRNQSFNEEEFLESYRILEKSFRKYRNMEIALLNGPPVKKNKASYLMTTVDDIFKIRNLIREMKFRLKFAIDISKFVYHKNPSRHQFEDSFNKLKQIRNTVIGIHLSGGLTRSSIHKMIIKNGNMYLNEHDYPENPDLLQGLSGLFYDSQCRYLVPEQIKSSEELEELIDDLLRAGFSFGSVEEK